MVIVEQSREKRRESVRGAAKRLNGIVRICGSMVHWTRAHDKALIGYNEGVAMKNKITRNIFPHFKAMSCKLAEDPGTDPGGPDHSYQHQGRKLEENR